ncbi:hypothetical protein Ciccas_012065, partial [Cichlidogyrus casuarinus]
AFLTIFSFVETSVQNLKNNWHITIICLVASAIFCLIYIFVMRFFTKFMVWFTLILFFLLFVALTGFSFYQYWALKHNNQPEYFDTLYKMGATFKLPRTWLIIGFVFLTIVVIFLVVLIFLRKRIVLAIAIMEEASKGLANMLSAILWPLVTYVILLMILALIFFVFIELKTVSSADLQAWEPESVNSPSSSKQDLQRAFRALPCNSTATGRKGDICRFIGYGGKQYILPLQIFTGFMGFWLINFVLAFHEMTLAGAFAYFYFRRHGTKTMFPILAAARNALFYHMGTLAFGALIVTIVQFIRTVFEYINYKLKNSENQVAKFMLKCCICCLYCLEKILRFINRNAYIMVCVLLFTESHPSIKTAIYSQNFCSAAANAFSLLTRNIARVFVLDKVADFVILLARLITIAFSIGLYYLMFRGHVTFPEHALSFVIVILGAFLIGKQFFDVYIMGVDTIFLC